MCRSLAFVFAFLAATTFSDAFGDIHSINEGTEEDINGTPPQVGSPSGIHSINEGTEEDVGGTPPQRIDSVFLDDTFVIQSGSPSGMGAGWNAISEEARNRCAQVGLRAEFVSSSSTSREDRSTGERYTVYRYVFRCISSVLN